MTTTPESGPKQGAKPDTTAHPEGAYPFGRDLSEVAGDLERPNDPSSIDPATGEVRFNRLPRRKSRKGLYITIGTAAAGAFAAGVYGIFGGGSAAPEAKPATVSATPNPGSESGQAGEAADPDVEAPEATSEVGVGVPGTTLETMNMNVAPLDDEASMAGNEIFAQYGEIYADIEADMTAPVTAKEFPTADDAIEHFAALLNARELTGQLGTDFEETPASLTLRDALDTAIFGGDTSAMQEGELTRINANRAKLATSFMSMNVFGDMQGEDIPTYRVDWKTKDTRELGKSEDGGTAYTANIVAKTHSNILELNPDTGMEDLPATSEDTSRFVGSIIVELKPDDTWVVRSFELHTPIE